MADDEIIPTEETAEEQLEAPAADPVEPVAETAPEPPSEPAPEPAEAAPAPTVTDEGKNWYIIHTYSGF